MFYNDILPVSSQTVLKVKLTDFSGGLNTKVDTNILPLNIGRNSYNFSFSTGALKTGMGFKDLTIQNAYGSKTMQIPERVTSVKKLWFFKRFVTQTSTFSPLLIIFSEGSGENGANEFFYGRVATNLDDFVLLPALDFSELPVGMNLRFDGKDQFVFCPSNSNDCLHTWDSINLPQAFPSAPDIKSLASHANRLFATVGGDKSQLWFSSESDPTKWIVSEFDGGFIEITDERGTLNSVISYNNNLYIIREFGITRLSGSGDQTNFVVKNLSLSNSKIYAKTVALCGDRILMFCRDGIYVFDGLEMTKLSLGFEQMFEGINNENACGAFLDGKYYLACKMNFNDYVNEFNETQMQNNALIELDLKTNEYSILRGVDICSLSTIQHDNMSKLVACFNGTYQNRLGELTHDGEVFGTPTTKVWESPYTDMDYPNKKKIIKSITMLNKYPSKIGIVLDGKSFVFDVPASNKAVKVPINLKGNLFAVGFYSFAKNAYVSNPQIEINLE